MGATDSPAEPENDEDDEEEEVEEAEAEVEADGEDETEPEPEDDDDDEPAAKRARLDDGQLEQPLNEDVLGLAHGNPADSYPSPT